MCYYLQTKYRVLKSISTKSCHYYGPENNVMLKFLDFYINDKKRILTHIEAYAKKVGGKACFIFNNVIFLRYTPFLLFFHVMRYVFFTTVSCSHVSYTKYFLKKFFLLVWVINCFVTTIIRYFSWSQSLYFLYIPKQLLILPRKKGYIQQASFINI